MLTVEKPKWLKGHAKEQMREYVRNPQFERCPSKGARIATDQRRFPRSIRSAAHAFLLHKKARRVFYSYPPFCPVQRQAEFSLLVKTWLEETRFHSSLSKKFMHPAYQTIMAMGRDALPLILRELQRSPGHWFYALRFIVQKDIAEAAEGFDEARSLWLEWGKKHHFIE